MVRDPHLAEDVTQGVFLALAHSAAQLTERPVLSGWLHRTAQNLAANAVRSDVRRRAREQEAAAMNELLASEPEAVWEQIAPQLDAALGELSDADRDAVLLRYFERKSAREMAQTLGTSEDVAQKRVNRAVERLRESLAKHGIAAGAGGLAVVVSANAVQAAPAGLSAAITTSVGLAGTAVVTTAAKVIAMTTLQKSLVAAALAVAVTTVVYQASRASTWRDRVQTLKQQQASLDSQIQQMQRERDAVTGQLAASRGGTASSNNTELLRLRAEATRLRGTSQSAAADPASSAAVQSWLARVRLLKARLERTPAAKIPELKLLTEQDWLDAAQGKLETDEDYRRALALLRNKGESRFASLLHKALENYMDTNNGQFPASVSELKSYFESSVDDAMLQRWTVMPAHSIRSLGMGGDLVITQKGAVDPEFDSRVAVGSGGVGSTGPGNFVEKSSPLEILGPALKAYFTNVGQAPTDPSQLLPFVTTPQQKAELEIIAQDLQTMSGEARASISNEIQNFLSSQSSKTK